MTKRIRKYSRPWVGIEKGTLKHVVFRSTTKPTEETHGDRFFMCIGPFYTKAGANFMAQYGHNNPHCQTVREAERLAKNADLRERANFEKIIA